MAIERLDHLVLTVASIEATVAFYEHAIGMRAEVFGAGRRALTFGAGRTRQKINLHAADRTFEPKADRPTPGSGDLCFVVDDLAAAMARLEAAGVAIIEGPVARTGAAGPIRSVYCRDPDGNLIELSQYPDAGDGALVERRPGETANELLTPGEMAAADRATIAGGTSGYDLMLKAGAAVAALARLHVMPGGRIVVLAGPGNNGGDGFVAAARLAEAGYQVSVHLLGERSALVGDAARAASDWSGRVVPIAAGDADRMRPPEADLYIDALFGAGLTRDLAPGLVGLADAIAATGVPVIAVDVPSGLDGETGRVRGGAFRATATATFFRLKPGHLLMPGRALCGRVHCFDISIAGDVLAAIGPRVWRNGPELWRHVLPPPRSEAHKYARGHAVVVSGGALSTGAARLAAAGAARLAGLVTVASPPDAAFVNAAHLTGIMVRKVAGWAGLADMLADRRLNAVLVGPGAGVGAETRGMVAAALAAGPAAVLDADALTSHAANLEALTRAIRSTGTGPVVLTPHAGEFSRLWPEIAAEADMGRLEQARAAARQCGAVVVLKGPDTVVAAPDGRASIADNAPPWLATAGSGDVLAGLVLGLLANGLPAFEAASAAVWLHGEAGARLGPGLIADELAGALPAVLAGLWE